ADQWLEQQSLTIWSDHGVTAVPGEEGIGQRCWVRADHALSARYQAIVAIDRPVHGLHDLPATPARTLPGQLIPYLLPSRYCESDKLEGFVRARFAGLAGGAMAAALVAAVGLGLWPDGGERIDTRIGEIRRMPLADGSVAMVNSGTTLRVAFTPTERHVEVSRGEAWFQVAHNPARPFIVASGPFRVQAVGTAFDVRREGDAAQVVVTKGVVKIWSVDSGRPPKHVAAGQWAVLRQGDAVTPKALPPQASDQQLAWREGR
ncbi:FecR domain-containing protein, partial [Staphylococcus aureus]|nr:FecR domain-containing protein [Staphylococcus aureus]